MPHPQKKGEAAMRVLIVASSDEDAYPLILQLRRCGYQPLTQRVKSLKALDDALARWPWDVVLAGPDGGGWNGLDVARALAARASRVPLILVTNSSDEQLAAAAMCAGACDFVPSNNLTRLVPAIERELRVSQAMRDAAESRRENEAKSRFLAVLSHELRTPLNSVLGFAQLLYSGEQITERQGRYVGNILTGGHYLLALINDILDLSRIAAGQMQISIEDVDVTATVAQAFDTVRPMARAKNLDLRSRHLTGMWVRADKRRLDQVLLNLLSNAIKFTPKDGSVTISAQRLGNSLELSVADTGIGIGPDDLERVFDEFEQLKGAGPRATEGTGLGLAISRHLVELMGGAVRLDSQVDIGSTFTVSLVAAAQVLAPGH